MQNLAIGLTAVLLYLVTGGLIGLRLSRGNAAANWPKSWLVGLGIVAILLHSLLLHQQIIVPTGMNLGFFNALSLASWLVALVLVLSAMVQPVENLGIVVLPVAAATIVLAVMFPSDHIIADTHRALEAHITLSILAYALLAMAAVQAALLAVQDHHLHNRRPGGFVRALPPLTTMETLLFQMIGGGFVALSFALLSGMLFLDDIFAQQLVHKTVLSIAAWAVFGVLLWGRWRHGWRGRTAIRWTLSGFAALVLSYFGSKLVLELILQRGA